jgi:hypothetical protein
MHINPDHATVAILILSATSYALLQALKRLVPGICGRNAVLYNGALNLLGVVALLPPDQVLTAHTLTLVLTATLTAAGFHGSVKTLTPPSEPQTGNDPSPTSTAAVALLILVLLPLAGCRHQIKPPATPVLPAGAVDATDATANEVLQAAHAFASRVTVDALSGKLKLTSREKQAVGQFNVGLNAADAVEIEYHTCGVRRQIDPTEPACDAAVLTKMVVEVESAFGALELTLAGK